MTNATTQNTLLLDLTNWDLVIDSAGNIAMATPPYSTAQDVASACREFLGDAYYNQTEGVNYLGEILGQAPPITVLQDALQAAALTVPGVLSASCVITGFAGRKVTGQITFTTTDSGTPVTVPL